MNEKGISVVVPFLNEEDGIEQFCEEIDTYAKTIDFDMEIVFVDDGSTDQTANLIKGYQFQNIKKAQLVSLSKNFGSHAAIRAGISKARYDICTWLGSDLQEPLELLERSYQKIVQEGYDAVYVERKKPQNAKRINNLLTRTYSALMCKYAVKNYSESGTDTIVFNKKIKDFLNENIEANSSIMLQIIDAGYRFYKMVMEFKPRTAGKSKWTLSKKIKLFIDSFVSFSFMPIRLVSIIGVAFFFVGLIIGLVTIVNKLVNSDVPMGYSTLASILALGFGVTNISLGIIAEYLWRTLDAARKRPVFIIMDSYELTGRQS